MHLTSSTLDWYAARAAGVVAYVLLTTGVSFGLAMSSRRPFERWPKFALEEVHRFIGLLVGAFITIHVVTIAIDSYLRFSIAAIVVPFVSTYRPIWVGIGVVAAELLLALAVTNKLRARIPYRSWRTFHYANFVVWIAATLHGVTTGTDRSSIWLLALFAAGTAVVVCLSVQRFGRPLRDAAVASVVLAGGVVALGALTFSFHARPWNARAFHDSLTGVVSRNAGPSRELVSVTATGAGRQRVLLRADLLIDPRALLDTSFQLEFLPSGLTCRGHVTHIDPRGFQGSCRADDGTRRYVRALWEAEEGSAFNAGTLDVHA